MINLVVGYKQQLGVVVKDVYGNVIANPPTAVWTFSNDLATVDATGLLAAGTLVGTGDVTATIAVDDTNIAGSASVEIVAGAPAIVEVVTVGDPFVG